MKVINKNIGTPRLSHYCPNCGNEVFNNSTVKYDTQRCCGISKCTYCGTELEFPNTADLLKLLSV